MVDYRPHDREALDRAAEVIDQVRPDQLGLPTPCPPWTVADLIRHMIGQNLRFGAGALGQDPEAVCPLDGPALGDNPAADFRTSADLVTAAFESAGTAGRAVTLPELSGSAFPAPVVIGFHFTDFVVHAWDVARSIGATYDPPEALAAAALRLVRQIPDTPRTRGQGAPFARELGVPADAPVLDQVLGVTGRDPGWTVPARP